MPLDSTWNYFTPGRDLFKRCKLHFGEESEDAGEIQKIQVLAHHYLPASDAVNSPKAGFASVPDWMRH